jgi:hypothetical protein
MDFVFCCTQFDQMISFSKKYRKQKQQRNIVLERNLALIFFEYSKKWQKKLRNNF